MFGPTTLLHRSVTLYKWEWNGSGTGGETGAEDGDETDEESALRYTAIPRNFNKGPSMPDHFFTNNTISLGLMRDMKRS